MVDLPLPIPNREVKPRKSRWYCNAMRGVESRPFFILEKGIIMDISSILWGFIASYLAGSLPSLREFISTKDKQRWMKGLNNAIRQHWDDGVQTMPSGSALPKNTLMTLNSKKLT